MLLWFTRHSKLIQILNQAERVQPKLEREDVTLDRTSKAEQWEHDTEPELAGSIAKWEPGARQQIVVLYVATSGTKPTPI